MNEKSKGIDRELLVFLWEYFEVTVIQSVVGVKQLELAHERSRGHDMPIWELEVVELSFGNVIVSLISM